jgi:hypothetical protein
VPKFRNSIERVAFQSAEITTRTASGPIHISGNATEPLPGVLDVTNTRKISSVPFGLMVTLMGCGGGNGGTTENDVTTASSSHVPLTGDPYIDGLNFGLRYDTSTVKIAVSGGMNGEYWNNPSYVLDYFEEIVSNTLKFTNLNFQVSGSFVSPQSASYAGSDITLVPYNVNSLQIPYGVLGFAYPVGYEDIYELSDLDDSYDGIEGDVFVNFGGILGDVDLSFAPGSQGYLLVLHELGHSLGLKHPQSTIGSRLSFDQYNSSQYDLDEFTVMSYNDNSDSYVLYDPITPMILDIIALQFMYGKNQSINSGDTSHNIIHTGEYYTIWDPSGNDTINLTNSSWDWYVELPSIISSPIHGEYVGVALTENRGSAPTDLVWLVGNIENIWGGAGDEILVGNHLNNFISGGAGDDVIYGKGGSDILEGDSGEDFFYISLGGGQNVINDFKFLDDAYGILEENGDDANNHSYSSGYNSDGNLTQTWSDGTSLTFNQTTASSFDKSYSFSENDTGDLSDYDFLVIDGSTGTITIHLEDYNFFDLTVSDFIDGSSREQFAFYVSDVPTESSSYVSPGFNGFEWRNADSITVNNGAGLNKTITVQDEYIKSFVAESDYDYFGFLVRSDNYYVGDDFLISSVSIV